MYLHLGENGFIKNWLVSGPLTSDYIPPDNPPGTWNDQLGYEKTLRSIFFDSTELDSSQPCLLGENSGNGMPWEYYYNNGNWFVDASTFYGSLTGVELDAVTEIYSDSAKQINAVIWTYASLEIWLNNNKIMDSSAPVYKPICKQEISLSLSEGANRLYVHMQNLGIRDTRNIFGIQLKDSEGISIKLPDWENTEIFASLQGWIESLTCKDSALLVPTDPPAVASLSYQGGEIALSKSGSYSIPKNITSIEVSISYQDKILKRHLELIENIVPVAPLENKANHKEQYYRRLSQEKWEPRGHGVYFSVFHVLSRLYVGTSAEADEALINRDLDYIESCGDCADFLVIGLIRLIKNYKLSEALEARIKKVLLGFRYWMDELGKDGMCFWSENHTLMFYGSQLVVGSMYPDDIFTRSGATGKEQESKGYERCTEWLDDVLEHGAEEFNSASYFPVTMTALLNLVDFAPEPISDKATLLIDNLLRLLCHHVFKGSVVSPQGRVYRDVISPFTQSVQSILHFISADFPYSNTESMWNICFATSKYEFPDDLIRIAGENIKDSYTSGNARININKTDDFILTSVSSPRAENDTLKWENISFDNNADRSTYLYIKSLNERFHGTNVFQPGVYGYQQHLWYAALSNECIIFTSHPGSSSDLDSMRPGYWYGHGVFPAVTQSGNSLAAVYSIPEDHPISFTHLFWPTVKFDQVISRGGWLFGRKDSGYVAVWCSGELKPFNSTLTGCEYRCYDRDAAYFCVCSSDHECKNFEDFIEKCLNTALEYEDGSREFRSPDIMIRYKEYKNDTQYI